MSKQKAQKQKQKLKFVLSGQELDLETLIPVPEKAKKYLSQLAPGLLKTTAQVAEALGTTSGNLRAQGESLKDYRFGVGSGKDSLWSSAETIAELRKQQAEQAERDS